MPQPGLWGWPEHSARLSSDLATYRYVLHHPGGARGSTHPGAPWVPQPHLGPSSRTRTAKTRAGRLKPTAPGPDQKPVLLTPGGSCPVALPPFEPSSLLACGASGSPPPRRRICFDLLGVGTTWCAEREGHLQPAPPCLHWPGLRAGGGARPGTASPLATESQSRSSQTCPQLGLARRPPTPNTQMGHEPLIWLCSRG